MKILYLTTSTEMGGAEKAMADLAIACAKKHQVRVLSLRPCGKIADYLKENGIEVFSFNLLKKTWPGRLIQAIQKQLDDFKPDVVHGMLYWGMELARLACAGRPIRLVTTPHFDFSKRPFYQRVFDFLLKGRDFLTIAESFSTARYLVKNQKYPKEKVFFLPNCIDSTRFFADKSLRQEMRQKYQYKDEEVVIVQVSRLSPEKDPITLLAAFRNVLRTCPYARLVFVGEGSEHAKLENFIKESHLEKQVFLPGMQPEVNAWLNLADIFVLPSKEESLPISLLEALQVGLPCVVSKAGDMPLWVEHGQNGFVFPPQDITLLSCFLTELCTQKSLRVQQGKLSSEKMNSKKYSFPHYQHIYEQILTGEFSRENKDEAGKAVQ